MGLFDFVKTKGQKLFSSDSEADQKIEEHILATNPGIKNFKAKYKNPIVYLSGDADSFEALQKAVLLAGNVEGVESVNVEGVKVKGNISNPQEIESHQSAQYYVIQSGDTLSKLAERFYGSSAKYSKIFDANREVIKDPNLIYPGQKIRIPQSKI